MCSEVFLDINFTSSWLLLFFHIIWHWLPSYFSYVLDGIWETNNYLTTFRIYLPFCTFGRSEFISGICMIVSPVFVCKVLKNPNLAHTHLTVNRHMKQMEIHKLTCLHLKTIWALLWDSIRRMVDEGSKKLCSKCFISSNFSFLLFVQYL